MSSVAFRKDKTMAVAKRWSKKKKAGTQVWYGRATDDLPYRKLGPLDPEIFASYSGPDVGMSLVPQLDQQIPASPKNGESYRSSPCKRIATEVAGCRAWNIKSRKAYGICMSLYDQHPINGKISGDPIADSFAICARQNNALIVVADGVNWGEKSKLAARCAVFGCIKYLNEKLYAEGKPIKSTHDVFTLLLSSLDTAHQSILQHEGGLTTLCVAFVCPVKDVKQYIVCIVNVGDSLAYVFSKRHGIREITTGSHDIENERDIRDAGGALGPVNGKDPELHNLTCSMTYVDPGDIVYLTTDGISDNFDPVVTKIAIAKRRLSLTDVSKDGNENSVSNTESKMRACGLKDGKPEMQPHERHQYAVKEMERIIHEFELFTEMPCSAQELCGALLQHVLKLTDSKRKVLENPDLYGKKLRSKDRKRRDSEIVAKMSRAPGKLDHATIVGYEVGIYHGNEDEDYELVSEEDSSIDGMSIDIASPINEDTFRNVKPDESEEEEDNFFFIDDEDEDSEVREIKPVVTQVNSVPTIAEDVKVEVIVPETAPVVKPLEKLVKPHPKKGKLGGLPASLWLNGTSGLDKTVGLSSKTWSGPTPKWNEELLKPRRKKRPASVGSSPEAGTDTKASKTHEGMNDTDDDGSGTPEIINEEQPELSTDIGVPESSYSEDNRTDTLDILDKTEDDLSALEDSELLTEDVSKAHGSRSSLIDIEEVGEMLQNDEDPVNVPTDSVEIIKEDDAAPAACENLDSTISDHIKEVNIEGPQDNVDVSVCESHNSRSSPHHMEEVNHQASEGVHHVEITETDNVDVSVCESHDSTGSPHHMEEVNHEAPEGGNRVEITVTYNADVSVCESHDSISSVHNIEEVDLEPSDVSEAVRQDDVEVTEHVIIVGVCDSQQDETGEALMSTVQVLERSASETSLTDDMMLESELEDIQGGYNDASPTDATDSLLQLGADTIEQLTEIQQGFYPCTPEICRRTEPPNTLTASSSTEDISDEFVESGDDMCSDKRIDEASEDIVQLQEQIPHTLDNDVGISQAVSKNTGDGHSVEDANNGDTTKTELDNVEQQPCDLNDNSELSSPSSAKSNNTNNSESITFGVDAVLYTSGVVDDEGDHM